MFRPAACLTVVAAVMALTDSACGGAGDDPAASKSTEADKSSARDLPPGRFAFRRFLDDAQTQGAVFTIKTDGSGEKQITHPPTGTVDDQPDWSPDGKRLAFERCSDQTGCVAMVVPSQGGQPRPVKMKCRLSGGCDASAPAWTPDGRLVIELAQGTEKVTGEARQIQRQSLELVDLSTRAQRTIVKQDNWSGGQVGPTVSADGRTVVYTRENSWLAKPAFAAALYSVGIDGSGNRRITPFELGGGDRPAFSPDGVVFFRSYDGDDARQSDYWTVKPNGEALAQLTHVKKGTLVLSGSYSPDGQWIVHASDGAGGAADLYVMKADGSENRPFTRTKAWDSAPDWGPAGG
jgi:TolB protein